MSSQLFSEWAVVDSATSGTATVTFSPALRHVVAFKITHLLTDAVTGTFPRMVGVRVRVNGQAAVVGSIHRAQTATSASYSAVFPLAGTSEVRELRHPINILPGSPINNVSDLTVEVVEFDESSTTTASLVTADQFKFVVEIISDEAL